MRLLSPISLFTLIDFLGVFVAAIGGGLEAVRNERYDYDFIGVIGLALASALGGGITRDMILQRGVPLAFLDVRYLLTALAGAGLTLVYVAIRKSEAPSERGQRLLLFADASAIGLFAVAGATRATNAGLSVLPVLILGVVTAVGGGALRDVLSGQTPKIFVKGQPYAIAATLAGGMFLAASAEGASRQWATTLGGLTGFMVRWFAMRYRWETSGVRRRA